MIENSISISKKKYCYDFRSIFVKIFKIFFDPYIDVKTEI